jgi:hypothetical protein
MLEYTGNSRFGTVFIHDAGGDNLGNWDVNTRRLIRSMAETGSYYLEGKGTVRTFLGMDDLIFLPADRNYGRLLCPAPLKSHIYYSFSA